MNGKILIPLIVISFGAMAAPILQMNKAFISLQDLLPVILDSEKFKDKKNAAVIEKEITNLGEAFKLAGHDPLIKHDLFAPSYEMIRNNMAEAKTSFANGHKDYSRWLLKETVSVCLDCHTRIPKEHTSSFETGELTINQRQKDPYLLGLSSLIVRRYVDAKNYFLRQIQDQLIAKDSSNLIQPFQQILLIEAKIMRDPKGMIAVINDFQTNKDLPATIKDELTEWKKHLEAWKDEPALTKAPADDKAIEKFIKNRLIPLQKKSFIDAHKVDMLFASGVLSNYFFIHQDSKIAPDLSYWLGWIEKRLKREDFLSSGDLFLKQCIRRYPKSKRAKDCLKEYEESIEFDFSGSRGTEIPEDVTKELSELKALMKK